MIMIPQTKGGVGKSTVAMQVIAPYLFNKHKKKIRYIEIDDENKDSNTFFNTKIVDKEIFQTHKFTNLDELILMDDSHEVIVDVGGNKTTSMVLDQVRKVGSFDNIKWIIPMGDGELDGKNALDTLEKIIAIEGENCPSSKIMFSLSRAVDMHEEYLQEQFINFFGHKYLKSNHIISEVINKPNYFALQNDKIITISRYLGSTVWEMANHDVNFADKVLEAKAIGDLELAKKYLFFRRIQNESKEYNEKVLKPVFSKLDNWFK